MTLIGTHNGTFHCDEALACFLLKLTKSFKDAEVVRSRDPEVLKTCDVVVDVGGVYDPATHRYDHHQREFTGKLEGYETKLSSAGLVYKHFGREIIENLLSTPPEKTEALFHKVYQATSLRDRNQNFVEGIDAIDNGVAQYDSSLPPRYRITTDLSARVGKLNPAWNKPADDAALMAQFRKAMETAGAEFVETVQYYGESWLPARDLVEAAVKGRHGVHPSGEIALLENFCPWKDHLFTLEEELKVNPSIKYVLYADTNGSWRVQCVPLRDSGFENRRSLPAAWRGLRDDALSAASGVPGCVFVHAGGFIGGNKTREGALAMAARALEIE
eukprot:tig00000455_g1012.t1